MSAHRLLDKIASHPSLYDPTADEIPIIEFLHRQRMIDRHLRHDGTAGYHITRFGFIYLRAKDIEPEHVKIVDEHFWELLA